MACVPGSPSTSGYRHIETDVQATQRRRAGRSSTTRPWTARPTARARSAELTCEGPAPASSSAGRGDRPARRRVRHLARAPAQHRREVGAGRPAAGRRRHPSTAPSTASAWRRSPHAAPRAAAARLGPRVATSFCRVEVGALRLLPGPQLRPRSSSGTAQVRPGARTPRPLEIVTRGFVERMHAPWQAGPRLDDRRGRRDQPAARPRRRRDLLRPDRRAQRRLRSPRHLERMTHGTQERRRRRSPTCPRSSARRSRRPGTSTTGPTPRTSPPSPPCCSRPT